MNTNNTPSPLNRDFKMLPLAILGTEEWRGLSSLAMRIAILLLPRYVDAGEEFEPITISLADLATGTNRSTSNVATSLRELLQSGIFERLNVPRRGRPGIYQFGETAERAMDEESRRENVDG